MEGANQTDNEKNGDEKMELRNAETNDETESTCDKDEEVTEKSEEVSSPLCHVKQTVFH